MKAMNNEQFEIDQPSSFNKFETAKPRTSVSVKAELVKELENIASKKNLTLEQLRATAEASVYPDEDFGKSLRLFRILASL